MRKVIIIDDQTLFLQSLSLRIDNEKDMQVVYTSNSLESLAEAIDQYEPDVVLLDIYLKEKVSTDYLESIKRKNVKIILLTSYANTKNVTEGIAKGADAIISKDIESDKFISIINSVCLGLHVLDENVYEIIREYFEKQQLIDNMVDENEEKIDFSVIEREIVKYISSGKTNAEIATLMDYSEGTIKNYISKLNKKMNTFDRTGIMIFALKHQLI